MAIYLLQVMALGLAGSLLGVVLARLAIAAIPLALGSVVDVAAGRRALRRHLERRAAGHRRSACSSRCCSRSCRCCEVRLVKPSLLLRDEARPPRPRLDADRGDRARVGRRWWRSPPGRRLAARRARRLRRLRRARDRAACWPGGCWCARWRRWRTRRRFRCGTPCCTCRGPGNQTRVILLAVGLGAFFIVGVRSLQASLLDEFSIQIDAERAGHVPDRHPARARSDGVRAFLARSGQRRRASRS